MVVWAEVLYSEKSNQYPLKVSILGRTNHCPFPDRNSPVKLICHQVTLRKDTIPGIQGGSLLLEDPVFIRSHNQVRQGEWNPMWLSPSVTFISATMAILSMGVANERG